MLINKSLRYGNGEYNGQINEPSVCPLCKHSIKPVEATCYPFKDEDDNHFVSLLYLCKHCYKAFVTFYSVSTNGRSFNSELIYSEPNKYVEKLFDDRIKNLSPQFNKIYNQALAAETYALDEIAGIGYRKAVEFLVKDYIIYFDPEKEENVKSKLLMNCIRDDIADNTLLLLASRSVWIGNDETHYVKRHEDKDINDLKKFIEAMVNYINIMLIAKEAESIQPK